MAYMVQDNTYTTDMKGNRFLSERFNDVIKEIKAKQLSKSDAYALLNERYPLSSTSDEDEFLRLSAMMEI